MQKKTIALILLSLLTIVFLCKSLPAVSTNLSKHDQPKLDQKTANPPTQKARIIIDPGHGGADSGVDKGHIVESEVTLDISRKLKTYLEEKPYIAEMTRSSGISLYKLSNIADTLQRRELDARANIIDNSGSKIFVSIHVNSYPQHPEMSGSIVYYNPLKPQSRELAEYIQKQLNGINVNNTKRDSHIVQQADFYLLENTTIPGVLVETAFITNSTDYKLLSQESFKSQIAKAVADGIEEHIKGS